MTTFPPGVVAQQRIQAANCLGTLTINGIAMNRDAWAVLNVMTLWQPAPTRGESVLIPGKSGLLPVRRRATERKVALEMLVVGTVDRLGDPTDDAVEGLERNLEYLETNVFTGPNTLAGTYTAVLTLPSGRTRTGAVIPEDPTFGQSSSVATLLTFDIAIPAGRLASPV